MQNSQSTDGALGYNFYDFDLIDDSDLSDSSPTPETDPPWAPDPMVTHPSVKDIFSARRHLLHFLPAELANIILNEAEYWIMVSQTKPLDTPDITIEAEWHDDRRNIGKICIFTPTLKDMFKEKYSEANFDDEFALSVTIKKVIFRTASHDQGWTSFPSYSGIYEAAFSWFEAIIYRGFLGDPNYITHALENRMSQAALAQGSELSLAPNPCSPSPGKPWIGDKEQALPEDERNLDLEWIEQHRQPDGHAWLIQKNVRGKRITKTHEVAWVDNNASVKEEMKSAKTAGAGLGSGFIGSLRMDDRIIVLARAQTPAWKNVVKNIQVEVYFSV